MELKDDTTKQAETVIRKLNLVEIANPKSVKSHESITCTNSFIQTRGKHKRSKSTDIRVTIGQKSGELPSNNLKKNVPPIPQTQPVLYTPPKAHTYPPIAPRTDLGEIDHKKQEEENKEDQKKLNEKRNSAHTLMPEFTISHSDTKKQIKLKLPSAEQMMALTEGYYKFPLSY